MKEIEYKVSVGVATTCGNIFVPDDADNDDIRLAIVNDLHSVHYDIVDCDSFGRVIYVVDIGGAEAHGEIIVDTDASDADVLIAILNNLYGVTYKEI